MEDNLHRLRTTIYCFVELTELFCIYDTGRHVSFFPATQRVPSAADTTHTNSFSVKEHM